MNDNTSRYHRALRLAVEEGYPDSTEAHRNQVLSRLLERAEQELLCAYDQDILRRLRDVFRLARGEARSAQKQVELRELESEVVSLIVQRTTR